MEEKLRQLQLIQLEILKFFDNFCREHNLKYSLYAGSLLGAIRHHAFIPWDDDLDVCMSRFEYDRFIDCGTSLPQEDIFFRIRKTLLVTGNLFPKFAKIILLFCRRNEKLGSIIPGFFWIFFLLTVFRMAS